MSEKGLLIVISGPSGAGKGTICKSLLEKNNDIKYSISCTTRSPRVNEKNGVNYFFIGKQNFENMIKNDEFLEYAAVYDNYYGTPKSYVKSCLDDGNDVILEIDIQGALKVKQNFPEGVFVFIIPPSMEELKKRIQKRGSETEESLLKRFNSAFKEINYVSNYNYVVVNEVVEDAVKKLESIITAEKCRVDRIKKNESFFKSGGVQNE